MAPSVLSPNNETIGLSGFRFLSDFLRYFPSGLTPTIDFVSQVVVDHNFFTCFFVLSSITSTISDIFFKTLLIIKLNMFELYTLSDTVIIKPNDLVTGIEKKLIEELKKRYAGRII